MKYWTQKNWECWDRLLDCISLATNKVVADVAEVSQLGSENFQTDVEDVKPAESTTSTAVEEQLSVDKLVPEEEEDTSEVASDLESERVEESTEVQGETVNRLKKPLAELFPDADSAPDSQEPEEPNEESKLPSLPRPQEPTVSQTLVSESSLPRAEELPLDKLTKIYFNSIPWELSKVDVPTDGGIVARKVWDAQELGGRQGNLQTAQPQRTLAVILQQPLTAKAETYFASLPWTGSASEADDGEHEETMRISIGTTGFDEGRNIRTADDLPGYSMLAAGMLSAARTSDRLDHKEFALSLETVSGDYFEAIPW